MAETEYQLKIGAILHDSKEFDSSKMLTNRNMSEELALFHLKQNPQKAVMFTVLPTDWKDRIRKMEMGKAIKSETKTKQPRTKKEKGK